MTRGIIPYLNNHNWIRWLLIVGRVLHRMSSSVRGYSNQSIPTLPLATVVPLSHWVSLSRGLVSCSRSSLTRDNCPSFSFLLSLSYSQHISLPSVPAVLTLNDHTTRVNDHWDNREGYGTCPISTAFPCENKMVKCASMGGLTIIHAILFPRRVRVVNICEGIIWFMQSVLRFKINSRNLSHSMSGSGDFSFQRQNLTKADLLAKLID